MSTPESRTGRPTGEGDQSDISIIAGSDSHKATTTGQIVHGWTVEKATAKRDDLRALLTDAEQIYSELTDRIAECYRARIWLPLGHGSWGEFCDAELDLPGRWSHEVRIAAVAKLSLEGMSTRAIGSALGVGKSTVQDDRSTVQNRTVERPATVTGLDGKQRARSRQRKPPPPPEPEPKPEPAHVHSLALRLWRETVQSLKSISAENQFANDVADAMRLGDSAWLDDARGVFDSVHAYLERVEAVLTDTDARQRAMVDRSRRDDMAGLRLIPRRDLV